MEAKIFTKHPTTLTGKHIILIPLEESQFDEICSLGKEKIIWKHSPIGVNGYDTSLHKKFLEDCISKRNTGEYYPFSIVLKETKKIIGFTTYHSIKREYKNLEIGATWLHPRYWSKNLNTECKYLMLEHCFETLGLMRVQFRSNDNNLQSRKAIEKIGGIFEGIFRKDKILEDGSIRNAAIYSIIDNEWEAVKKNLEALLS